MKKIIRLTEGDLHRIIENTVRRVLKEGTLNEYVSMKHSGHNLDDYLDDKDFIEIVNRVVGMYDAEEFEEDDQEHIDNMEMEIADVIKDFANDEAIDEFGYKYGETDYRGVAYNVIQYIQEHLDELY